MDDIQTRLNKIEGQLAAIKRMYEEERSCDEIVQ